MIEKDLLLGDSDVFINFFTGGQLALLPKILPLKLCILDAVAEELKRGGNLHARIKRMIGSQVHERNFDNKPHVRAEFFRLLKEIIPSKGEPMGTGEAACLALARYEGHYVASSNLSDILPYCKKYRIRIYATMDLLHLAYSQNKITKSACDGFVSDILLSDGRLPCTSFDDFLKNHVGKNPWTKFDQA